MYVKLFADILQSTVWTEDSDVRIVWITLLLLADADGHVHATAPGIAATAHVALPKTREALERFEAPDPDSRTEEHEGRRIERVPGGYVILNYNAYKAMRDRDTVREQTRERVRRHRAKADDVTAVTPGNAQKRHTDTDTDTEYRSPSVGFPTPEALPQGGTATAGERDEKLPTANDNERRAAALPGSNYLEGTPPLPEWEPGWMEKAMALIGGGAGHASFMERIGLHPPRIVIATILDVLAGRQKARNPPGLVLDRLQKLGKGARRYMPSDEHLDEATKLLRKWEGFDAPI